MAAARHAGCHSASLSGERKKAALLEHGTTVVTQHPVDKRPGERVRLTFPFDNADRKNDTFMYIKIRWQLGDAQGWEAAGHRCVEDRRVHLPAFKPRPKRCQVLAHLTPFTLPGHRRGKPGTIHHLERVLAERIDWRRNDDAQSISDKAGQVRQRRLQIRPADEQQPIARQGLRLWRQSSGLEISEVPGVGRYEDVGGSAVKNLLRQDA